MGAPAWIFRMNHLELSERYARIRVCPLSPAKGIEAAFLTLELNAL